MVLSDNIKKKDVITLSDKDRSLFVETLEYPSKPNKKLLTAAKEYKKIKSAKDKKL